MEITALAYAKINLTLDIVGKRADGYHLLESVMQSVDLCDRITIKTRAEKNGISVFCADCELLGTENTVYKAAALFLERTGMNSEGIEIRLFKRIPVAGGLGGGSADAAAVLAALNRLYREILPRGELEKLALKIGADVPFCLFGGTAFVTGIGERVVRLPLIPPCFFVIVKTGEKNSTGEMYQKYDRERCKIELQNEKMLDAIHAGDLRGIMKYCGNVFEPLQNSFEQKNVRQKLLEFGAEAVFLSGSGPSIVGLFEKETDAAQVCAYMKKHYPQTYLCRPVNAGYNII